MKILKVASCILAFCAATTFADALSASAKRVGPVSYYGALNTSGSSIIGSKNKQKAMLRGVSLFWSDATGQAYYKKEAIEWAVENLHIDVFRFAMAIQYYNSNGQATEPVESSYSYIANPTGYENLIDKMVEAAVENDVYIILDWHSHRAHLETSYAQTFFGNMAKKYAKVPNVIFEIYNEPVNGAGGNWSNIKSYATTVTGAIRQHTQNLVLVGTSNYSQNPQEGANDPVNATNIAYVLHFYAVTHPLSSFQSRITSTLNKGYPVFISEWGTTEANGAGTVSSASDWMKFMDDYKISNCNWSYRHAIGLDNKKESSAMFDGDQILANKNMFDKASFSTSGGYVKNYLIGKAQSWNDSLTKGKRTGSCIFAHTSAKETDSKISGVLKSGCSYKSSNESVVTISGTDLIIKGAGYSIISDASGAQSIVTINTVAKQTVSNYTDVTCNYTNSCTIGTGGSGRTLDYDGDGKKEYFITGNTVTEENSSFEITSLDPTIAKAKLSTCTSASCFANKGKKVWMIEFNNFGTTKLVAKAAAIPGYRALNDTVIVTYNKGQNRIPGFGKVKMDLGATALEALPDTTIFGTPVTYTFDGEATSPYVSKVGINAVAGNKKAIVKVNASAPETDILAPFSMTVSFVIGDTVEVNPPANSGTGDNGNGNGNTPIISRVKSQGIQATLINSMLHVNLSKNGLTKIEVFDMMGNQVMQHSKDYSAGNHSMAIDGISSGSYMVVIKQGSQKATLRWNVK